MLFFFRESGTFWWRPLSHENDLVSLVRQKIKTHLRHLHFQFALVILHTKFQSLFKSWAKELTQKGAKRTSILLSKIPRGKDQERINNYRNSSSSSLYLLRTRALAIPIRDHKAQPSEAEEQNPDLAQEPLLVMYLFFKPELMCAISISR